MRPRLRRAFAHECRLSVAAARPAPPVWQVWLLLPGEPGRSLLVLQRCSLLVATRGLALKLGGLSHRLPVLCSLEELRVPECKPWLPPAEGDEAAASEAADAASKARPPGLAAAASRQAHGQQAASAAAAPRQPPGPAPLRPSLDMALPSASDAAAHHALSAALKQPQRQQVRPWLQIWGSLGALAPGPSWAAAARNGAITKSHFVAPRHRSGQSRAASCLVHHPCYTRAQPRSHTLTPPLPARPCPRCSCSPAAQPP